MQSQPNQINKRTIRRWLRLLNQYVNIHSSLKLFFGCVCLFHCWCTEVVPLMTVSFSFFLTNSYQLRTEADKLFAGKQWRVGSGIYSWFVKLGEEWRPITSHVFKVTTLCISSLSVQLLLFFFCLSSISLWLYIKKTNCFLVANVFTFALLLPGG